MSLRGIRIYGDPVLGSRAEEVSTFDRGLRILANDMLETMDEAGGVGLAANQVGILKRIFVYDCSHTQSCLLYTSPSPRDVEESRMPSSA